MKGDFTRFTHNPKKHYSGVMQQQGRVLLDADWNEQLDIQSHLRETSLGDLIGHCGIPHRTKNGFRIVLSADNSSLVLYCNNGKPAHIYVDGVLCEMETNVDIPNPEKSGTYLAYLDVWQRHITALDDNEIADVALGVPDTTTRVKTEWQVRLLEITKEIKKKEIDIKQFCCDENAWLQEKFATTGKMAARARILDDKRKPCIVPANAGYQGLENRLYRVEIHSGGDQEQTTFKWSRDNGTVVFAIQSIQFSIGKSTIILRQSVRDKAIDIHVGDWIEISDDRDELNLKPGAMAQVALGSDIPRGIMVVDADVSGYQPSLHAKARRWDQKDTRKSPLTSGTLVINTDKWIPLEDGIEVNFKPGTYLVGDYWFIPARSKIHDLLWEVDQGQPVFKTRQGIEHHYCALAVSRFSRGLWYQPEDLRHIFFSLYELSKISNIPMSPKRIT